ncbi:MAG: tetratricopeptide repeat protein [Prevotellaceae bacterium]|nr:tetratricopeptide repeat protein [Prevotellaceae bacterium]
MNKLITYFLCPFLAVFLLVGCSGGKQTSAKQKGVQRQSVVLPQISHNDSLRFKMYFFEGVKQQTQGNFDAAYDLFSHCLDINPNAAEVYFMLSSYNGILQGDSVALEDVKKASELNPDNNAYLERLGSGYLKTNNLDEAIKAYEKLSKNSPERSDILDILTQLYGQKKDYNNMLLAIKRIEDLEGSSEQTTLAKMRVYALQGKKEEEFNELKSMSLKHPNDMNYRVMMGNWLLQNGKPEDAYNEYMYVLKQEPDNNMAQMSMVDYFRSVGQTQKADSIQEEMLVSTKTPVESKMSIMRQIVANNEKNGGDSTQVLGLFKRILSKPQKTSDMTELYAAYMSLKKMPQDSISRVLEQILEISPDNVAARIQLIQAEWQKQNYDRVAELSKQAIDYSPDEVTFYYFLGMAYLQDDKDDEALDAMQRGVNVADDSSNPSLVSDCYAVMGDILHGMGKETEAYAAYDNSLEWKDDNFGCLNNYAYYLSESDKQLEKAEQMSYRTVQAEPDNSTYLDTYAWILFKQKKYKDALEYIVMAVDNDSTKSSVIIEHAGDIHAVNGDIESALKYWNEALELDKENKTLMRKIKLKKYINEK